MDVVKGEQEEGETVVWQEVGVAYIAVNDGEVASTWEKARSWAVRGSF